MLAIVLWPSCELALLDALSAVLPALSVAPEDPFEPRAVPPPDPDRFFAPELCGRLRDVLRLAPLDLDVLLLDPPERDALRLAPPDPDELLLASPDPFDEARPRLLEPEDLARCFAAGMWSPPSWSTTAPGVPKAAFGSSYPRLRPFGKTGRMF
jgi:hypothetical protein